ncbi:MAG: polysaccharide biosynthesis protein, partial [Cyclobacteriaceae bacterium]|nr:polysaccharide biosynthesis protein [Cyclobacteriaceae bacterium]
MIQWIKNLRILPRWIIVILDMLVIGFAAILGYLLRFNFELQQLIDYHFQAGVLLCMTSGLVAVGITRSYRGIIRYTGLQDGIRILYTTLISGFLTVGFNLFYQFEAGRNIIPYSVVIITFLVALILLFYYRLVVKGIFSFYKQSVTKSSGVAIFGAGQSGLIAKHVIDTDSVMKVVAFLEDDPHKIGKVMDGIRIFDAKGNLYQLIKQFEISQLVISIKDLSITRKNEIVDICLKNNVKVRTVPPVEKWVKGELSLRQIKDVRIDDLLGRSVIQLDKENIKREILGKRVMVTGAAGSIGSEIARQVLKFGPKELILIDQ